MRARRLVLATVVGIAGIVAIALAVTVRLSERHPGQSIGTAAIGGPFTLVDDNGKPVTEKTLAGKPFAMYFGYTFCPDVCPTTLFDLTRWIKQLGPDADKINYVFVTVDPARDTPASMHLYLSSFDRRIRGYSGTPEQIARIAKEYRVYYKKVPTSDGSYVMDHSAIIYLMGPDAQFVGMIAYQERDATAIAKLKNLASLTPSS